MNKNENTFPISKDDITFYGDTEKERKANEEIFDMSLTIAQKDDEIRALSKEIDRLNNILNELEKWLDETKSGDISFAYSHTLNKLKELKETK